MSTIRVNCIDQTLRLTNTPVIASGGVDEDRVIFTFCEQWNGFGKTAVFYTDRDVCYRVLDENDSCVVPAAALSEKGILHISVFGCNAAGVVRTSEVLRYEVREGAVVNVTEPEPDVYEQILAGYSESITLLKGMGPLTQVKCVTAVLPAAGWADYAQTIAVDGATADNIKVISATQASCAEYGSCMVAASTEGAGVLTFVCETMPIRDLTVNILMLG